MPADLPTTPEQWDAIEPNETDRALVSSFVENFLEPNLDAAGVVVAGDDTLAAASRIAEHERCVERLADHLCTAAFHTRLPDEPCGTCKVEARRILEDRA